jgi:3-hydroxyisobutyrate dehydrogenase-like beta-hydroxyacid dehydrogenase
MNNPVSVLGLGQMGHALAAAFLRAGHPTTVWNRTAAKADDLVAQGATLAASPAETTGLVVICVADHQAVRGIIANLGPLDGRAVVNLTSVTPTHAREFAAEVNRRGGGYLDGGILAFQDTVGTAEAMIIVSGPRAVYDEHEATLATLGAGLHVGDEPSLSATHEQAGLLLMWSMLNAFLNGAAILAASGVPAAASVPFARMMIDSVTEWLPRFADQIDSGTYPADDGTIDTHLVSMANVVEESEALGVNTELSALVKALAERASAAGHGNSGYTALFEQFRKP